MLFLVLFTAILGVTSPSISKGTADSIVRVGVPKQSEHPSLERLDELKLKKLIASRKGRALFISVWATWCVPCVEEFPDIVQLSKEMKLRKIDFVGVSGDDFDDESGKVIPFIEKHNAGFKFYMAKLEGEDRFIDAFDATWGGGIPATFVYSANGKKVAFLLGKQSYASFKAAVEKALIE
jgi:thiol-disulfide isomerase/thioredoxin